MNSCCSQSEKMSEKICRDIDSPSVVLIPSRDVHCTSRWVNSTVNHGITNLIIGAIRKMRPEESCHARHMRRSLLFLNTYTIKTSLVTSLKDTRKINGQGIKRTNSPLKFRTLSCRHYPCRWIVQNDQVLKSPLGRSES